MIKFFIKTILNYLVLLGLLIILYFIINGFINIINDNFSLIILSVGIIAGIVWVYTAILSIIAYKISFMYWVFCLGVSIATLIITDKIEFNLYIMVYYCIGLMFMVPELSGEWTTYLNTVTYYNKKGNVISTEKWYSDEYTPGCIKKLATILTIAGCFLIGQIMFGHNFVWVVFLIESLYCVTLIIINVKNFFFSR